MDAEAFAQVASEVLSAVGGKANVVKNSVCMTRLRLTLAELGAVDFEQLLAIHGVLGVAPYHNDGIEVVFGPATVERVFAKFSEMTGLQSDLRVYNYVPTPAAPVESGNATAAPSAAVSHDDDPVPQGLDPEEVKWLRDIVGISDEEPDEAESTPTTPISPPEQGAPNPLNGIRRLLARMNGGSPSPQAATSASARGNGLGCLVINGANLNMLGVREPGIYGSDSYETMVELCRASAYDAGFARVKCFQSNHEGALVDEIQAALGVFDGIVINPGAYTHTSVAILDALKAVRIPAVEVHISKVDEREEFRQVSYVREACFETITGMGIKGYDKAIRDLYAHLNNSSSAASN